MHTREEKLQAFGRILDVLDELREKCPWDRKQTNESLRPQTLEEVYELSDAILKGQEHELSKELGDVLLHVLFYIHQEVLPLIYLLKFHQNQYLHINLQQPRCIPLEHHCAFHIL